jgi:glucose/arabinose dehydrogenase
MLRPRRISLLCASVVLAACGTPSASESVAADPSAGVPSARATVPGTPTPGASVSPPASTPTAADPPPIALAQVADGIENPIGIEAAPGGWLLVNEQRGLVLAIHPERGERARSLDLVSRISSGGERGLLGLALHPDWPDVGRAFIHYTDLNGNTVLSEVSGTQDGDGPPILDPASERVLLQEIQPYSNHNGGQIAFGPDGYLWMGLGDGGSGDDPHGNGQDTSTLLGSILRLDVSTPGAYAIPVDNPFADGTAGRPEIYLFGLRNPWRFSFDPQTGALWIADVGQNAFEEIDRVDPVADAGANLGWNVMEAAHCLADAGCSAEGLLLPLAEYGRELGCAVSGGEVYRGDDIGGLNGWYLFADYCTGFVFGIPADAAAPADGTALAPRILLDTGLPISAFGAGEDGEIYVVDHLGGVLSRIVAGGG